VVKSMIFVAIFVTLIKRISVTYYQDIHFLAIIDAIFTV